MAEHFLNGAQIGPFVEQMRGVGMPQGMGADGAAGQAAGVPSHKARHAAGGQASAPRIEKQGGGERLRGDAGGSEAR